MAETLWTEYKATGDVGLRNRLVLTYVPLVKHIVYKKIRELPPSCEVDDLISCGIESLIGAIDRWDPEKGAGLEPFLWTRIHGAVLDELRRRDAVRRGGVGPVSVSARGPGRVHRSGPVARPGPRAGRAG